jgi:hypothetical protein
VYQLKILLARRGLAELLQLVALPVALLAVQLVALRVVQLVALQAVQLAPGQGLLQLRGLGQQALQLVRSP